MNNTIITALVIAILIKIGIFGWFYLLNIYETRISVNPKSLTTNLNSKVVVKVVPLNSFGKRALLRNISARFEIISGASLVNVVEGNADKIILQSIGQLGKIEILVTPMIGLFPSKIEIEIAGEE